MFYTQYCGCNEAKEDGYATVWHVGYNRLYAHVHLCFKYKIHDIYLRHLAFDFVCSLAGLLARDVFMYNTLKPFNLMCNLEVLHAYFLTSFYQYKLMIILQLTQNMLYVYITDGLSSLHQTKYPKTVQVGRVSTA